MTLRCRDDERDAALPYALLEFNGVHGWSGAARNHVARGGGRCTWTTAGPYRVVPPEARLRSDPPTPSLSRSRSHTSSGCSLDGLHSDIAWPMGEVRRESEFKYLDREPYKLERWRYQVGKAGVLVQETEISAWHTSNGPRATMQVTSRGD